MSKLTPAQKNQMDGVIELQELAPETLKLAYMGRQLIQCTLPHHNPGKARYWARRNGSMILGITPGIDVRTGASFGYPWGILPRLLLYWMVREAVTTKSRKLYLGRNMAEFMRELGLNPRNGSGVRGDAKRLRQAMTALFRSRISFDFDAKAGERGEAWLDMQVAIKGVWWQEAEVNQSNLFESWIELGENFFNAICCGPVPLEISALRVLKSSSLALDFYAWATHRVSYLTKPVFIPWDELATQFGSNFKDIKEFSRKARAAMRKVMLVYPALRVQFVRGGGKTKGGIRLYPSPTAVLKLA